MYINPYRFDIGDLVTYTPNPNSLGSPESRGLDSPAMPPDSHGIVTEKRRESYYVEARPIKCVEQDMYMVVFHEGAGHWVDSNDLVRAQKTAWEWQDGICKKT